MKQQTELELNQQFKNELSQESKDNILFEPLIQYNKEGFRLDFVSKSDYVFLKNLFENIEERFNEHIDFDGIRKQSDEEALKLSRQEILEIQKEMVKLQSKKIITVKEFTELYSVSKTSQQNYRGRLNDPLPFKQRFTDGKITYEVEKVNEWFSNGHK